MNIDQCKTLFWVCKRLIVLIFLISWAGTAFASQTFSFTDAPLKEVVQTIQEETSYFFLYRESQIADIRLSFSSSEDEVFDDLRDLLRNYGISVSVNHSRLQVYLTELNEDDRGSQVIRISGQVVDANTGERLPFATLSWRDHDNNLNGVSANPSGAFSIHKSFSVTEPEIRISYTGYQDREIVINTEENRLVEDLTIRLIPATISGNEIVISGFSGYNPADTLLSGMIDAGRFSPLGESNSIRALQAHPSVTKGTALNDGINVRGSTPDGFLVTLDGMSIFNQSHLFGLLDSFNADAVQSSGFYYGVTPANIETPTGGSLNLITRTGSRNGFRNSLGISNTSINSTLEGPLGRKSSWMLSARTSYIDAVSWFNNDGLIQWGLDIDRPKRVTGDTPDFTDLVLRPGANSAEFIDLHGKIYLETARSGQFTVSGYFGGNRTSQNADRRTRSAGTGGQFVFEEMNTTNQWGNLLLSLKYEQELFNTLYSTTLTGISSYETDFEKDDFVYSRISENSSLENRGVTVFTYPFQNRSVMNEVKFSQELEYSRSEFSAVLGAALKYYLGEYSEFSFDRPSYFHSTESLLTDAYLQTNWSPFRQLELHAGTRFHHYSSDNQLYISPRIQARISILPSLNLTAGYSVNHQFLHRVSIQNATTADVWILSTENQPPASSEQITTGIQFSPSPLLYFRVEAYKKSYENLRLHELNTQSLSNPFSGTPWFYQNNGEAKGLEFILRNRVGRFTLSQTYTLSEMQLENPFLLDGEPFYADWDRTHSYNAVLETRLPWSMVFFLSWTGMSGAPNELATFGSDSEERLESYSRVDATLTFNHQFSDQSDLNISFSVFNLLNTENVWYRTYDFNFDETRSIPRLRPVAVDVLDLGFQPSFKVQYSF